jgi:sigma-B regulation protein RsbU (phosphoserine phosphatase)
MQASETVAARHHAHSATILVVDDSPVNLQVLVRTLNGSGHRILAAKNGRAALEIARRARPDLMLLDVMMPELDGFEVCRAIKSSPETEDTLVIFLSALGEVADKVSGLELGAVDYITKPIQAEEVLARVANHLTRQYLERELRQSRDRLERELTSAGRMQRLILPAAMPVHPAVGFAAFYQTSRHAGGDYYDVLNLGGGRFGIIVADVSGHGAPAAIVMAMIRAVVHSSLPIAHDPAAMLHHLNRHFCYLWESAMFATAIYGVLDAERRTLRVACAGHPPPLVARPGAPVTPLPLEAVISLLWQELGDVPVSEHAFESGDRLIFYTDGITEREAPDGSMFDDERFHRAIQSASGGTPDAVVARLVESVERFAAGHEPGDDQTLLVLGVN